MTASWPGWRGEDLWPGLGSAGLRVLREGEGNRPRGLPAATPTGLKGPEVWRWVPVGLASRGGLGLGLLQGTPAFPPDATALLLLLLLLWPSSPSAAGVIPTAAAIAAAAPRVIVDGAARVRQKPLLQDSACACAFCIVRTVPNAAAAAMAATRPDVGEVAALLAAVAASTHLCMYAPAAARLLLRAEPPALLRLAAVGSVGDWGAEPSPMEGILLGHFFRSSSSLAGACRSGQETSD